ncbi:STAS domain-containing protein [Streptomyces formicae]|uniref:Anti-sigma factor antagonist n=1 Tax=Streptomyces formicae TaxID=1616117 RepID=A0A291Q0R7_9ACTN|nr:STAS domain-containing protein [Streptomyces formicae]ATL25098.1 hypothetical protein KY5_0080 [Streptomyces formicae]
MAQGTPFTIETLDVLDTVLIHATGEIDLHNIGELAQALASHEHRLCELDLSQTTFIDSTTLTTLLGHRRRATAHGGALRLIDASPNVQRVFDITGTAHLFGP